MVRKQQRMQRSILCSTLLLAASAVHADNGSWGIGTGYNYSSGKYGTPNTTTISSVPVSLGYENGPWIAKLTIPYIRITGSDAVVAGLGKVKKATGTTRTDSGLGDVVASTTYNLFNDAASRTGVDLTGRIKFGTADANKNLGTGKNDYGAQIDVYRQFNQWTVFSGLGYTMLGSSAALPLRNVFNVNLGTSYKISPADSTGLS
jgi:hypothetical protein